MDDRSVLPGVKPINADGTGRVGLRPRNKCIKKYVTFDPSSCAILKTKFYHVILENFYFKINVIDLHNH